MTFSSVQYQVSTDTGFPPLGWIPLAILAALLVSYVGIKIFRKAHPAQPAPRSRRDEPRN